jgi:ribosome-binding factor A
MSVRRQKQIAELLHQEISQLLQREMRDPRLALVTVTGVEVSADYRLAYVYVSVLGDKKESQAALQGLAKAAKFLRRRLSNSLSFLRFIPELQFRLDTSLEYGLHIDHLLDQVKEDVDSHPSEPTHERVD